MVSFSCQICGVDMATARIRTPSEPPSAAWNYKGVNYVGFSPPPSSRWDKDEECQQCTTMDRTPTDPQVLAPLPLWPSDGENEDDNEWLPSKQSDSGDGSLAYDSDLDTDGAGRGSPRGSYDDEPGCSEDDNHINSPHCQHNSPPMQYPLSDLFDPPLPDRLPHGTWHNGTLYYSGNRSGPHTEYLLDVWQKMPLEHIASPSCQSSQGINGHVLSLAQMKNCRNIRFLVPKPPDWRPDTSDRLLEEGSLFYLSGESNGSNWNAGCFQLWRSFYPPRHGLYEISTSWEMIEVGCDKQEYDALWPLAVHSYCLDIYAKASYHRLGQVALDGLWHWREMRSDPDSHAVGYRIPPRRPEIERARECWNYPWRHLPGDEWLAANPVEIPDFLRAVETCINRTDGYHALLPDTGLLALPAEIIHYTLSFLDLTDVDVLAKTCRTLYEHAQPIFKAHMSRNMNWLWEVFEGSEYPASPDWPATWDPLCPPGLVPPTLPVGLESEEAEGARWATIIAEEPEMEGAASAAKALNRVRRDEIFGPYRAKQESSLHEWQRFRAGVEAWTRHSPRDGPTPAQENRDWRRMWRLCSPMTTPLPGLRNRARIWEDCNRVMDCVSLAHDLGDIDKRLGRLHSKLSDPSQLGWSTNLEVPV
ncbi:hypothetical protein PG987_010591 [Apiospora arundinis]